MDLHKLPQQPHISAFIHPPAGFEHASASQGAFTCNSVVGKGVFREISISLTRGTALLRTAPPQAGGPAPMMAVMHPPKACPRRDAPTEGPSLHRSAQRSPHRTQAPPAQQAPSLGFDVCVRTAPFSPTVLDTGTDSSICFFPSFQGRYER